MEVTHEEHGIPINEQYYSWRVNCNDEEFENDLFHSTCGVVDQKISDDLSLDTCLKMAEWAMKVAQLTE